MLMAELSRALSVNRCYVGMGGFLPEDTLRIVSIAFLSQWVRWMDLLLSTRAFRPLAKKLKAEDPEMLQSILKSLDLKCT